MDQMADDRFTMLTSLQNNPVDGVFVKGQNSRCPSDTVTFGNGQNNSLDLLPAIVRVHKDCTMILGEPMIACLAAKQTRPVLAVPCTGGDVSFTSDPIIRTLWARTEMITEIGHILLLSVKGFPDCTLTRRGGQEKSNND
jgi:hypothetical protein